MAVTKSKADEAARQERTGAAPLTSFDLHETRKRLRDEAFSDLGASGAALSRHFTEEEAAALSLGRQPDLQELPELPRRETLYGETQTHTPAEEEQTGLWGGIDKFFSRRIDFSAGGAKISGKTGHQVRGGAAFLFQGAVLDLAPARLTGRREEGGVQSAGGGGAILFLSPVNLKSLTEAAMSAVYLNSAGDIFGVSAGEVSLQDGQELALHLRGLSLAKSGERPAGVAVESLDVEAPLGEAAVQAKDVPYGKIDGGGLSFSAPEAALKDVQSPYPAAFFKPKEPIVNVSMSKNGLFVSAYDALQFSDACAIRGDGEPAGNLICVMDETGDVTCHLVNLERITFKIDGRETVLRQPVISPDGRHISYESAAVMTEGFAPMEINEKGRVGLGGFETGFQSEPAELAQESSAAGAEAPAERIYQVGDGSLALIRAMLSTQGRAEGGSVAQKTGGEGFFRFQPLAFNPLKEGRSEDEAVLFKQTDMDKPVPFTHDAAGGVSASLGNVTLEGEEDGVTATLLGVELTNGAVRAAGVKISREGDGFKLEAEADENHPLSDLLSFSIPSIGKIELYDGGDLSGGQLSSEFRSKKLGAFTVEDFLGKYSLTIDYDEGIFKLKRSSDKTDFGADSLNPKEPIPLAMFLLLPTPPLWFSLSLKPKFEGGLAFGLEVAKEGGFGRMAEGDRLELSGTGEAEMELEAVLAGDLRTGLPGVASLFAGLTAGAQASAGLSLGVSGGLVKKDGRLTLDDGLDLDFGGEAALKGKVGFHAGASFLIWDAEFFEYTFKEWTLASMEANAKFTKDLGSPGLFRGWRYAEGAFSAEGFGKSFKKGHTAANRYRFEAAQTLSVSDEAKQFSKALDAVRAAAGTPVAFDSEKAAALMKNALGKAREELLRAAEDAQAKLQAFQAEFEQRREQLAGEVSSRFTPHREKHLGRTRDLHANLDRYGLSEESDRPLFRQDMADRAVDQGDWVERLRDYEEGHKKKGGEKHKARRALLENQAGLTNRQLWDAYTTEHKATEKPGELRDELDRHRKAAGLDGSYGFEQAVRAEVRGAFDRFRSAGSGFRPEDVARAIRFEEGNVRSYHEGEERERHLRALALLKEKQAQGAAPDEIISVYRDSLGTAFFGDATAKDLIGRRNDNAREFLLYTRERLDYYNQEQARMQSQVAAYTVSMAYLTNIIQKSDQVLAAIDAVCAAGDGMLREGSRKALETVLEDGAHLAELEAEREKLRAFEQEAEAAARAQLESVGAAMAKALEGADRE